MPFVQRVVQPVNIAQVVNNRSTASVSGKIDTKFHCIPGKCSNNNCINKQNQQQQQYEQLSLNEERNCIENIKREQENGFGESTTTASTSRPILLNAKDTTQQQQQQQQQQQTQTFTKALIHTPLMNGDSIEHNQTNGFASSFTYVTDNEEDLTLTNLQLSTTTTATTPTSPPPTLPMKKLKQHVEFLSTAPSPSRNHSRSADSRSTTNRCNDAQHRRRAASAPQSPTASKIVSGFEFDSISNITLSNALRQLASLVLIASDIFDNLQMELQTVGDRARIVQRKIVAVEQCVSAYDPKMVTVPESDLLTFAQRKNHYESDKSVKKELFTAETRPHSVRQLYEDAGKITPPPRSAVASLQGTPHSPLSINGTDDGTGIVDITDTGVTGNAAGSDELVCTPVFGRANRTMRTRIDSEIEIRLPAAIEDLRKWTSSEALGDVTVTPDCMHHVDTSICTSMIIGDNGVLTPALSPSVLSADAVDALYSINVSNINENIQIPNEINKDVPLNHRLPSPEEQCKIIALRYPAEIISVDTSGKRFQRMCLARKSTTGCYTSQMAEANNLNDDVQTVSRRSRSRKVRGKRRNTIAGIDQKEIQDAANGDTTATSGEIKNTLVGSHATNGADDTRRSSSSNKKFGRSKSSDILKKESVALPYDKGKSTLTRLNSLKQWGRNRFKFMQRSEQPLEDILDTSGSSEQSAADKTETNNNAQGNCKNGATPAAATTSLTTTSSSATASNIAKRDIDDECVVHELISQKSESRFSHERKPSYSSSEKSMSVSSSGHLRGKLHLATCGGNVKLRDTASLNRQRRNGISTNVFGGKDEQPHSSSGNWSASSESGRASIGSEITIQPKSSASNTSLNVSSFHPGSGPPSSMLSRRRFMNTSASSSVTSEGTATPDLQVVDGAYPNHMDDETSSAYSCDTEGYYTSFHMDSGLRTLKEEEPPITPLQTSQHLHTSNYSFGSQSNQTVLTAENEYELFGRGSTSTTTSSAGTVCTTLMINGEQNSLNSQGPDVPERISSLSKLNRSSHSNSASTSTLERSYSSSTIGSTLERTGTIKRNTNASLKLATSEISPLDDDNDDDGSLKTPIDTPESQDNEFDYEYEHRIRKRAAQPLPQSVAASLVAAEMECSESSDLECVERIERIKQKTTLNAKRIPSMCIITPTTSDDENHTRDGSTSSTASTYDPNKTLTNESLKSSNNVEATNNQLTNMYSSIVDQQTQHAAEVPATLTTKSIADKDYNLNQLKRTQTPLNNMIEKFKVVLPNIMRSPSKTTTKIENKTLALIDDDLYADVGEYVYITDISNNNHRNQLQAPKAVGASGLGIYYSNDIIRRRKEDNELQNKQQKQQQQQWQGQQGNTRETTEYISLNELPLHLRRQGNAVAATSYNQQSTNKQSNSNTIESEVEKLTKQSSNCADAMQTTKTNTSTATTTTSPTAYVESSSVPMYAEISELREEKTLLSPLSQQKGARVRLNAQGKIIYESDSLKRRKGAHTTFAPGPYVKETESALSSDITTTKTANNSDASNASESTTKAAKLLLLNGGVAATRKIANVRPIVATSPLTRVQPVIDSTNKSNMSSLYVDQQSSYQEQKQILANQTNPFFQNSLGMMPSPSTKSTSSTGSTISSTPSTLTTSSSNSSSSNASASSREEAFQRFYKANERLQPQHKQQVPKQTVMNYQQSKAPDSATTIDASPFQRNTPVYWTLQNRRQAKPMASSAATSRDDLYATPIKRSERVARAAAAAATAGAQAVGQASPVANAKIQNSSSYNNSNSHIYSPIIPRNRNGAFSTSTPNRNTPEAADKAQWDAPERLNICADRIGQSKTSLMDFKKLLLAKSAKNSPVQRKVSAVELLKKANSQASTSTGAATLNSCIATAESNVKPVATSATAATPMQPLNSSMKLLDLSGSPKTFANRRMLRQGQFGSPSKTFASKNKPTPNSNWRSNSVQLRTDIMSTAIPEATNSEEDPSNSSSSGASNSSRASSVVGDASLTAAEKFDIKRNFFLQTDENNFMRGELKPSFGRNAITNTDNNSANNKFTANTLPINSGATSQLTADMLATTSTTTASQMPALETAL